MANVTFEELGFPIVLVDPPIISVRGHEVPDVNLRELQDAVFRLLVVKPARLTGAEVRFIRKHLRLRQVDLAEVLNRANHTVVSQWESRGDEPSGMEYNTEVLLRLWMATRIGQGDQIEDLLNSRLRNLASRQDTPLKVSVPLAV
jgi:DNA-binding transcriptional regulator YiaG